MADDDASGSVAINVDVLTQEIDDEDTSSVKDGGTGRVRVPNRVQDREEFFPDDRTGDPPAKKRRFDDLKDVLTEEDAH